MPAEVVVVWGLLALVAVEVLVTYTRTPPRELYYVSGSGFGLAVHQVLLFIGFPAGLVAIAVVGVVADRVPTGVGLVAMVAVAGLGAAAFLASGAEEAEVDVRPVSALTLAGVAIAVVLTVAVGRRVGVTRLRPGRPGDRARIGLALLLGLLAIPWLAADLGFSVDQIPLIDRLFITDAVRPDPGRPKAFSAVHDGHHHGMDGVLLAWSALLLTRVLPDVEHRRRRGALGL